MAMDRHVSALFSPRHLLATLVVAIATGALGLTVAAGSGEDGATPPPPDPWLAPYTTPGPNVGDRGRYVDVGGHDTRDDGYWPPEISFEWLEDGEAYGADASRVLANQLLLAWPGQGTRVIALSPGSVMGLSGTSTSSSNGTRAGDGVFFPDETSTDRISWTHFAEGRRETMWCGIQTPLQGLTIDLRQPAEDRTDCWNGPHSWATDDYSVIVHEVGGEAPERTIVVDSYDTEDLDRLHQARPFLRSTYREGFPYAVRVEFMSGDVGPGPDGYARAYELVASERGTIPVAMQPRELAPAPPPLVLAERTEAGMDLGGFQHAYPLSLAWANARADPSFTELHTYLAEHPDAYIGQAQVSESNADGRISYHWYIVLTDGAQQYGFRNIHTPGPADQSPAAVPLAAPLLQAAGGDSYDRLTNGWEDGPFLPRSALPAQLPTVASLVASWQTVSGRIDANAYGFDFRCTDRDGDCLPNFSVFAGHDSDSTIGVAPTLGSERFIDSSLLWATHAGGLSHLAERQSTYDYEDPLPQPTPPAGDGGDDAVPQVEETAALPGGNPWVPTKGEAAALGGVAVLATLAYWLWPIAKGGGLGLFSRVHKDRLLDNALRAQLVQRIEAEPGIHHNALVRDLGKGKGAAEHHLDKLVAARLVLRHRSPGYTCYFPLGTDARGMAGSHVTKSLGARRILQAVANGLGGVREVAAATGMAPSTVSHHLERLRGAGLVMGDGRTGYHLAPGRSDAGLAAA